MAKKKEKRKGMVQVYTGDGKGKTTCSMGLALRAVGNGHKVLMLQFLKHSNRYGELFAAKRLAPEFEIVQMGRSCVRPEGKKAGFICDGCMACHVDPRNVKPEDIAHTVKAFEFARKKVKSNKYDLIILDEINVAVGFGLITQAAVLRLIKEKPARLELVLTGRRAKPAIIRAADLVTEMKEVKHYYKKGVMARPGVEF